MSNLMKLFLVLLSSTVCAAHEKLAPHVHFSRVEKTGLEDFSDAFVFGLLIVGVVGIYAYAFFTAPTPKKKRVE